MSPTTLAIAQALLGGILIGLASWLLLMSLGRVAGISAIVGSVVAPAKGEESSNAWRWAFVLGLVLGGALFGQLLGIGSTSSQPVPLVLGAGILVGVGTILGSGCTSGHGVCGLGRRSARSLAATLTFMGVGMVTVALVNAFAK